jgi:hypothetical protein
MTNHHDQHYILLQILLQKAKHVAVACWSKVYVYYDEFKVIFWMLVLGLELMILDLHVLLLVSTEKTKVMLIYRRKPRASRKLKMKIRIGTEKIAMVKHHRILGLVIVERMNWNKLKKGQTKNSTWPSAWAQRADQKTLLTIHQMIIVSTLIYGKTAYGSASKAVLRKQDSIYHRGVRLVLGTFAVCKTENVLCEAGLATQDRN